MKFTIIITIAVSIFLIVGLSIAQKDSQQTSDKPEEQPKEIIGKDGAKMVLIPAGEFQMGTDPAEIPKLVEFLKSQGISIAKEDWFKDETPRHTVYVDAFYMDVYEVTNAQYRKFVQETGHREPEGWKIESITGRSVGLKSEFKPWADSDFNKDNQPVVCVSWEDAKAYAEWAGKRLPTEAEWEYAARGGLVGKRYVWGDDWPPPKDSGNFADETLKKTFPKARIIDGYDDGYAYAAPVGSYKPNGYGLYDMAGNVWEWCADWYDKDYYAYSPKLNPKGPDWGSDRVLRGGSWLSYLGSNLRAAGRSNFAPIDDSGVGFRCVQ